jgi:hypothetical protein
MAKISSELMNTLRVETIEGKVPALFQSIKKIKSDWGLL